jgi:hypothetical protein
MTSVLISVLAMLGGVVRERLANGTRDRKPDTVVAWHRHGVPVVVGQCRRQFPSRVFTAATVVGLPLMVTYGIHEPRS